ncbi:MAG: hypothetical protein RJB66_2274 [Pseudomonadota bacterium]
MVFLFQVLFVFFAMVVNVGLLVYYKINLQNSVDLAAYYGAMKQAEMLNAIGHINYQMRQSWKLLAFRSSILGSLGPDDHPASNPNLSVKPIVGEIPYTSPPGKRGFPIFCITIAQIYGNLINQSGLVNTSDNQCRRTSNVNFPDFAIPPVLWTLPGFNQGIRDGAIALQDKYLNEFSGGGFRNFNTLASFIIQFRADSLNRRKLIGVLANSMSGRSDEFFDTEGNSVSDGAKKVLLGNLAQQNSQSLGNEFQLYNSLADPNCGGASGASGQFGNTLPGWLKEIDVNPLFIYFDSSIGELNPNTAAAPTAQDLRYMGYDATRSLPQQWVNIQNPGVKQAFLIMNELTKLGGLPNFQAGRWTDAIGVEKNPWCMPYIGFRATTHPKLPFMPASFTPKLVAKTFAKPFGSRIGPWYGKTWSSNSAGTTSDNTIGSTTDGNLPPRQLQGATGFTTPPKDTGDLYKYTANFSRFVGDNMGLLSEGVRQGYGRFFWKTAGTGITNPYWAKMWTEPNSKALENSLSPADPFYAGPFTGDILSDPFIDSYYANLPNPILAKKYATEMRKAEMAAIAPDLFDINYYSIEPRYDQFYVPRLTQFVKNLAQQNNLMVRGDLGWRYPGTPGGAAGNSNTNIETQINSFKTHEFLTARPGNQIFHTITDPSLILTSWAESNILDYNTNVWTTKVAKCDPSAKIPEGDPFWYPGACTKGGRTGYSVKVISQKFLEGYIPELGGTGLGGQIVNPPSPNF